MTTLIRKNIIHFYKREENKGNEGEANVKGSKKRYDGPPLA
jgi:hypothetical protein